MNKDIRVAEAGMQRRKHVRPPIIAQTVQTFDGESWSLKSKCLHFPAFQNSVLPSKLMSDVTVSSIVFETGFHFLG